jgi:hypothetical protein
MDQHEHRYTSPQRRKEGNGIDLVDDSVKPGTNAVPVMAKSEKVYRPLVASAKDADAIHVFLRKRIRKRGTEPLDLVAAEYQPAS